MVSLILLGIRTRLGAVACQWMCVAIAGFFAAMKFWLGLLLLIGALGYWLAIRWMDKNDSWPKKK